MKTDESDTPAAQDPALDPSQPEGEIAMSHDVSQLRSCADVASPTQAKDDPEAVVLDGLTQRQLNALDLLIGGSTVTAAAKTIGVCRRTLTRWKNEVEPFKI